MKQDYQKTMYACFIGYIVQAVVEQLRTAAVRNISEHISYSTVADHTFNHD